MPRKKLKSKTSRFALIVAICLVFLEIFLFNFNSFRLIGSGYEKRELDLSEAKSIGFDEDREGIFTKPEGRSEASFEIFDIGIPAKTITFDIDDLEDAEKLNVTMEFADATTYDYASARRSSVQLELIDNNTRSRTAVLQLSGNVEKLRITFKTPSKDSTFDLSGITLNEPVPVRISIVRMLALFGLVMAIYALLCAKAPKAAFEDNPKYAKKLVRNMTIVLCLFALIVSADYLSLKFDNTTGNQVNAELVDAFRAGQVHLIEEPSEELLALNNPYDITERRSLDYLWDHCLYEGQYYSYYGIAPVLFLFLPYNLITNYYFPTSLSVLIFTILGIICLTLLYYAIIKRWFRKLPISFVAMGLFILQFASGIWFSASRPLFYEIAIASGFASVLAGAYFLITSNIISDGTLSLPRLSLSSVFLSIAVLCRPTLAVYCVAALIFIWFGREKLKTDGKKTERKALVKYLLAALVPFAVIGSVQIIYNYLRFGNPLEFGIQYSLTINDFTRSEFDIHYVLVLVFAFLFNAPSLIPNFPFFTSEFQMINLNGYMFVDNRSTPAISMGLFFRALPMFSYLLAPKALRYTQRPKRVAVLLGATCIAAPLLILFSAWESGYSVRYSADISWPMLLGALFILFTIYQNLKNEETKRILLHAMTFATVMCFLVNFAQIYYFILTVSSTGTNVLWLSFARLFEFWR